MRTRSPIRLALSAFLFVGLVGAWSQSGVGPAQAGISITGDRLGARSPAAGGTQVWTARYDGPAHGGVDSATAVAVSPNGSAVYVTGASDTELHDSDYATEALSSV
ncbi:MAG TPA: hypothetical protein VF972_04905, partial [Actinomycetota bacterium]